MLLQREENQGNYEGITAPAIICAQTRGLCFLFFNAHALIFPPITGARNNDISIGAHTYKTLLYRLTLDHSAWLNSKFEILGHLTSNIFL